MGQAAWLDVGVDPDVVEAGVDQQCFEAGMDIFCLKKLLGHTYLTTTEIYVHDNFEYQRQLYERSSVLAGAS